MIHPCTAEDGFTAMLTLEGGASAVIDTAWAMPVTLPECWTIAGTKGIIEFDEQKGLRLPGRVVDLAPGEVRVGMRVKARLEKLPGGEYVVPVFVVV